MLFNTVKREMQFIFSLCFGFRESCLGLKMASVIWFSINVWGYPHVVLAYRFDFSIRFLWRFFLVL